jgi:protein phosphatase
VNQFVSYGATDAGRRRQLNEDSLFFDDRAGLYIVADGMGGHNAGEIASRMAIEAITAFIRRSCETDKLTWPFGIEPNLSYGGNRLRTAVMLANRRVWREADSRAEYTGMGTTVVSAIVEEGVISICSAGDSRAYRIREWTLEQITIDDSWVQAAYNVGAFDETKLQNHPMRSVITKAVGAKESLELDVAEEQVLPGDIYLLCSDGLHGMLEDAHILDIMREGNGDLQKSVTDLIAAANQAGGRDNITVLLLRSSPE